MKNHVFIEIIDAGYIISDETKQLLFRISQLDFFVSEFQESLKGVSTLYPYENRFSGLLLFIDYSLLDNLISETETTDIALLKTAFEIVPGDFYKVHRDFIMRIVQLQYHIYILDNKIDFEESEEILFLQKVFDIDADQMSEFILLEDKK